MRIRAIDWLRGLVIALMTVDHAGNVFDSGHMHGDNGATWVIGSALPAGEFLTRWVTHLCAPVFVMLAGASLALSDQKRRDQPGQTRFIVLRGLLIAALDPLWMSLGFTGYHRWVFQVLYAIGVSIIAMAFLRRLPSSVLLAGAVAIQAFSELSSRFQPEGAVTHGVWAFLWTGGLVGNAFVAYPLIPWLSMMMFGWVLWQWLLQARQRQDQAMRLALLGLVLLSLFALVRGLDGYGNWNLHRDSIDFLQWLHVAKYPPSISYTALELGLGLLLFAAFLLLDDPAKRRVVFAPLALFGATAFFYYLCHVHLMVGFEALAHVDPDQSGLAKAWIAAAVCLMVMVAPCLWFRRYKRAHPDGWARFI